MQVEAISVIVTCFNGEAWIKDSLTSILQQCVDCPIEIIVIDDNSQDGTVAAVRSFNDPRIRLYRNHQNFGTARSRNLGIQYAAHSWIAFNDQDDVWLPGRLSKQCAVLERNPHFAGVAGGHARLAKDGRSRWTANLGFKKWSPSHSPVLDDPPSYIPAKHGFCYVQSLLIKKTALLQINGFREDLPIAYDPDLFYRLGETVTLAALEEPVFLYRLTPNSITGPNSLVAGQFLGGFAYVYAAQAARTHLQPEPKVDDFLAGYQPSDSEIDRFVKDQLVRSVNTHWVNDGILRAAVVAIQLVIRQPGLMSSLFSRLIRRK